MSEQITQYFDVTISSPKSFNNKREGVDNVHSVNVTKYIEEGIKISDEDGLIKEASFDMDEGFLFMDVFAIGMQVIIFAGDYEDRREMFNGYIKTIAPEFKNTGDVSLKIVANSNEGGALGVQLKDLAFPSKNHNRPWARQDLMYSDIITNIAKDSGIRVESKNIRVLKDIKASIGRGATRQHNTTDWTFMQFLANKIRCTLWTIEKGGNSYLHLVDNNSLVKKVSEYTFFFLSRTQRSEFINFTKTSPKQIQIIECKVNLDTQNGGGKFKQKLDPSDGKTKLTTEVENTATGKVEVWVLDEDKVNALPKDEQRNLMGLFMDGKINWEGTNGSRAAKDYFKLSKIDESTRAGENNNVEVEVSSGELNSDGITSKNSTTENSGSKSYKTVISQDKVGKLSPEKRSSLMGRIYRGETTQEDRQYYEVVDTTPKKNQDDENKPTGNSQNTQAGVDKTSAKAEVKADRDKRDAGFSIEAKIFGNLNIVPKMSYYLEGLGKYSDTYYLYKISYEWGKSGFIMNLTFTK